jgi:2-iminobutanoate/2-iminopropanoate deaminase
MATPPAVGPYSPIRRVGDLLFTAGQIGQVDGRLVDGGFEAQARQAFENLVQVLATEGVSPEALVKTTVFLTDIDNYSAMNSIYMEFFAQNPPPPARSALAVAALPMSALIEIEAIAYAG